MDSRTSNKLTYSRQYYARNKERVKGYVKKYNSTPKGKIAHKKAWDKFVKKGIVKGMPIKEYRRKRKEMEKRRAKRNSIFR